MVVLRRSITEDMICRHPSTTTLAVTTRLEFAGPVAVAAMLLFESVKLAVTDNELEEEGGALARSASAALDTEVDSSEATAAVTLEVISESSTRMVTARSALLLLFGRESGSATTARAKPLKDAANVIVVTDDDTRALPPAVGKAGGALKLPRIQRMVLCWTIMSSFVTQDGTETNMLLPSHHTSMIVIDMAVPVEAAAGAEAVMLTGPKDCVMLTGHLQPRSVTAPSYDDKSSTAGIAAVALDVRRDSNSPQGKSAAVENMGTAFHLSARSSTRHILVEVMPLTRDPLGPHLPPA